MTKSEIIAIIQEEFGISVSNRIRKSTAELLLAELREPDVEISTSQPTETHVGHYPCSDCGAMNTVQVHVSDKVIHFTNADADSDTRVD